MKKPLLLVVLMAGTACFSHAATYSWVGTNGSLWSSPASWNLNSGDPDGLDDTALFNNNSSSNRSVTVNGNRTIGVLGVGYVGAVGISGNTNLSAAGYTVTVGSSTTPGQIYVGSSVNNLNATGVMSLVSGTFRLIGGSFLVGARPDTAASVAQGNVVGTVNIGSMAHLYVGTSTERSDWWIGRRNGTNFGSADTNGGSGIVKASTTGGYLTAWVNDLVVGLNASTVATTGVNESLTGTLDLAALTTASIDANRLDVGVSLNSSAKGALTIGAHSLTVREAVRIGVGKAFTGTGAANQANMDTVNGTVTFAAGANVNLGVEGVQRVSLEIGTAEKSRGPAANSTVTTTRTGELTATGGTFSGYLSSVIIGSQNAAPVANQTYTATGNIDLRQAAVTQFDVGGNLTIGNGAGEGSHGTLRFSEAGAANAVVRGNLVVGDSVEDSSGLMELGGTVLEAEGDVSILLTGRVTVRAENGRAGLSLAEETVLTITAFGTAADDANAGYFIEFLEPVEPFTGIYAGFSWSGNQLTALNSLISSHAITWINLTSFEIGAYYDIGTNTTYIGVVPEPGSIALVFAGLGLIGAGRHIMRHRRAFH